MRRRTAPFAGFLLAAAAPMLLTGCGGDGPDRGSGLDVVRDTVGDTVVVRTLGGSVWGAPARLEPEVSIGVLDGAIEYLFGSPASLAVGADGTIYVVDRQVPDLRAFAPDGTYLATLARPGEGPGELKSPDGGLTVLSDGRIVVRDPGNARLQVFDPDGSPAGTWPHRGGLSTGTPMFLDRNDNVYVSLLMDPRADVSEWVMGQARIGPDGVPGDTLIPPDTYETPVVEARNEGSTSQQRVPFAAAEEWAVHPGGYFVHGVSTAYAITLAKPDGPLRIERRYTPVPVTAGERAEDEARITQNMRRIVPSWRWNGPPIPDEKPPFRDLFVGRDGRIWVQVSAPGVQREDPDYDPSDPDDVADEWREPVAFDVFEEDGTYLGQVNAPDDFRTYPTPVFDGDLVWATTQDELGVVRVVRYRIEHEADTDD